MNRFSKISAFSLFFASLLANISLAADLTPQQDRELALYLAVSGGWNHLNSASISVPILGTVGEIFFDDGWTGSVAVGAHLTNHVRAELELAAHRNGLNHEDFVGVGRIDLGGGVQVYDSLVKIAYDFGDGPLRPFVGAGVGVANFGINLESPATGSDNAWALAGALEAGLNYSISPHAELFATGQLLMLGDVHIDPTSSGGGTLSHPTLISTSVGVRWNF